MGTKKTELNAIIIEDEREIVESIYETIYSMKIFRNIVSARDGLIGLNKIQKQDFSLIILDLNLPKKSGIEVLERLVLDNRNYAKKIIIISGDLVKNSLELMLKLGVKNFLVKPFDSESFKNKIREIIAKMSN